MATVTLRIDDDTRDELASFARAKGVTLSDLIRLELDDLLDRNTERVYGQAPQSLSLVERRILANQHRILAKLEEDKYEIEHHQQLALALEQGWTAEYPEGFNIFYPELSRRDCTFVMDVLDMYRVIRASLRELPEKERKAIEKESEVALTHAGFDFNDPKESPLSGYVEHLIGTGRWKELSDLFGSNAPEGGNSHMPTADVYRRMLEVFQPSWKRAMNDNRTSPDRLTGDEIRAVFAARIHPENRKRYATNNA